MPLTRVVHKYGGAEFVHVQVALPKPGFAFGQQHMSSVRAETVDILEMTTVKNRRSQQKKTFIMVVIDWIEIT
jgi:hypothetical protein